MLSKIFPREGRFFNLFEQSADLIVEASHEFQNMLSDLDNVEKHSHRIKDLEHQADEVTHRTIEMLHKTFITPIDREDIHQLITRMDDILDCMEACSQRIVLYEIRVSTPDMMKLADVCVRASECMRKTIRGLHNLKRPEEMLKDCVEINRLENEGDTILRSALAKLFRHEPDTRQLMKLKEIYELLEAATDRCEDVADIIEGIVLEFS